MTIIRHKRRGVAKEMVFNNKLRHQQTLSDGVIFKNSNYRFFKFDVLSFENIRN